MPTILNNVTAMAASRQIGITQLGLKQAIERLTTGKRVNRASDDAAGMINGTNFERIARNLGFSHAACGPMVRSSYHADEQAHLAGLPEI